MHMIGGSVGLESAERNDVPTVAGPCGRLLRVSPRQERTGATLPGHRRSQAYRRVSGFVAGVLLALPILTACATPPPSAAAEVGGVTISEADVFAAAATAVSAIQGGSTANATTPGPLETSYYNRGQATSAIRSELLDQAAATAGVTVTEEDVNAALANAATSGSSTSLSRQAVRDLLLLERWFSRLPADGAAVTDVTVGVEGEIVADRAAAVATRTRWLSRPDVVAGEVAAADSAVQNQFQLLQQPALGALGIYHAAVGDVILAPAADGGIAVLRITSRQEQPAQLTAAALQQASQGTGGSAAQQLNAIFDLGALLLAPTAKQVGVTVNPRIGAWDPVAVTVVPVGDGL